VAVMEMHAVHAPLVNTKAALEMDHVFPVRKIAGTMWMHLHQLLSVCVHQDSLDQTGDLVLHAPLALTNACLGQTAVSHVPPILIHHLGAHKPSTANVTLAILDPMVARV